MILVKKTLLFWITVLMLPSGLLLAEEKIPEDYTLEEEMIAEMGLPWNLDEENDYRFSIPLPGNRQQTVWLRNTVNTSRDAVLREILSIAGVWEEEIPEIACIELLEANYRQAIMGGWSIAVEADTGRTTLIYLIKVPADADADFLRSALLEAAEAADATENTLEEGSDWY